MNIFELGFFLVMVSAVILCSRELERLFAIPEALAVPLIIGILVLLLRVFTKIRPRALLYLSALLAAASLVSMGLAKALDLREEIFMIPVSVGLTLIVIRGALLAKRRRKASDANNSVQE
jgi:hypothetical protein